VARGGAPLRSDAAVTPRRWGVKSSSTPRLKFVDLAWRFRSPRHLRGRVFDTEIALLRKHEMADAMLRDDHELVVSRHSRRRCHRVVHAIADGPRNSSQVEASMSMRTSGILILS
jgi:hypothetical protein